MPWEKIYFQEGTIQFWYRDFDQALSNLKKVAAAAGEIDLNTGVYTYLRIGAGLRARRDSARWRWRSIAKRLTTRRNRTRRSKPRSGWGLLTGGGEFHKGEGRD